jgi:hypothetical protein
MLPDKDVLPSIVEFAAVSTGGSFLSYFFFQDVRGLRWGHCVDKRLEGALRDQIRKQLLEVSSDDARQAKTMESVSRKMKLELSRAAPYRADFLLPNKSELCIRAVVVVGCFLLVGCPCSRAGHWRYPGM